MDEQAQAGQVEAAEGANPRPAAPGSAAGPEQNVWDDPRIPWSGRPRRVDILCWAGIMLSGLYYWALLPFVAPLVGTHPVLLEVLNGNSAAIISAAAFVRVGHGSLVVVLLAAIPGLMKFDLLYWWAGRLWGERLIAILSGKRNRGGRYMNRVERWGRKFTWPAVVIAPFLPLPNAIIYVIAGWAGMGWVTFLILDAIGTLAWAGLLAGLGYELGHHAVVVAQSISHYGLWVSIGLIVVIVIFQFRSQRRLLQGAAVARQEVQEVRAEARAEAEAEAEARPKQKPKPSAPPNPPAPPATQRPSSRTTTTHGHPPGPAPSMIMGRFDRIAPSLTHDHEPQPSVASRSQA